MIWLMNLFQGSDSYFGLDIGTTGVRVVQLRAGGGNPALVTYGSADLPPGLSTSDSPMDQSKVADVIKQLVKDAKITTKNVVAGIPSALAFATVITTPKLNDQELAKAIKLQADQYIPTAADQVKMDWQVVGPAKDPNQMEVLLVSAPNTGVNKYMNIIDRAGLQLEALEMNAVALIRSLMPREDTAVMIVDVGSLYTDIAVVHKQAPKLVRSINVGGSTFIKAVSQSLGLAAEQAEQFTKKFGLMQDKLEGQVYKAIKPSLDLLVSELDKSEKFFASKDETVKIEKIILTGGAAALPDLPTYLANATGLPVTIANPWAHVSFPAVMQEQLNQMALEYPVAIGLAERSLV